MADGMSGNWEDPILDVTRWSFFLAFGVTPAEQMQWEQYYLTLQDVELSQSPKGWYDKVVGAAMVQTFHVTRRC
jgi:hypothetical protein